MVGLYAAYGLLDFVRLRLLVRIGNRLDRSLHQQVFAVSLLLPLKTGHEGNRIQPIRDLDQIRSFVSGTGPTALFDLPWIPVYLVIIYMLHPSLGILATLGAAAIVFLDVACRDPRPRPGTTRDGISDRPLVLCRCRTTQCRSHPSHGPLRPVRQAVGRTEPALPQRPAEDFRRRRLCRSTVAVVEDGAAVPDARARSLSRHHRRGIGGRDHRFLHHARPLARPGRHRDRQLERLQLGPPMPCATQKDLSVLCGPPGTDVVAAPATQPLGRRADGRRTWPAEADYQQCGFPA